ncbi:MAG TPA: hypothetical protein VFS00_01970, partial [Polyangiaceae bacterium]|nr:hypothetical protein [Polyangiaceae bacterium]
GAAGAGGAGAAGASGAAGGGGAGGTVPLRVTRVAAGAQHTCAVVNGGEVRCWGKNDRGQLGDGTTTDRLRPVPVELSPGAPLAGVQALSLGGNHGCAVVASGRLRCWGDNASGALGDGSTSQRLNPVLVDEGLLLGPLENVAAPVLGSQHSCALLGSGGVRCWGRGDFGELGDGTFANHVRPVAFVLTPEMPVTGVLSLAAGEFRTCILTASGDAYCRGNNLAGQLGNGTTDEQAGPVRVEVLPGSPLRGIEALQAGREHTCARVASGQVQCWGENSVGQLGDGSTTLRPSPVAVELSPGVRLADVQVLALGGSHSCALRDEGLLCWGANAAGQLGDGTTENRSYPAPVSFDP